MEKYLPKHGIFVGKLVIPADGIELLGSRALNT